VGRFGRFGRGGGFGGMGRRGGGDSFVGGERRSLGSLRRRGGLFLGGRAYNHINNKTSCAKQG